MKIPIEIVRKMQDEYVSGASIDKITDRWKYNRSTISRALVANGTEIRKRKENILDIYKNDISNIIIDYSNGHSLIDIAREINCNPSSIRKVLIVSGIRLRTIREGIDLAKRKGKYKGSISRGPMSEEQKKKISEVKKKIGELTARGTRITSYGYIEFTRGPNKGRFQHVVIMEEFIGRRLNSDECVHHINQNKKDNRIENLVLMSRSNHVRLHAMENYPRRVRKANGRFE